MFGNDSTLKIIVKAVDQASDAFKDIGKEAERMGTSFGTAVKASAVVTAGVLAAAGAVGTFGVISVKAAAEAQAEMAKFNAVLATMGPKGAAARDGILAAANAAVRLGFDDEETANVIATLFQRTGDLSEALKLNSLAMDLARAKGIDLSSAGILIQQVMSGNQRALKQYGIEISDTLPPLEALGVLHEKVAGQAKAFSNTFQGLMSVFKVELQNFEEAIGTKLLPVLTELLKQMTPVLEKIIEWTEDTANLVNWLSQHQTLLIIIAGAIVGALIPAAIALGTTIFTVVIPAFLALAVAAAPWIIGGAIIGGLIAGIVWVYKNWDTVWGTIKTLFKDGINFLIGLAEGWANSYVKAANFIIGALNKIHFSIPDWVPGIGGKSFGINIPLVPLVSLPKLEQGGVVPGPVGSAVPIIAHGQETIIPAGRSAGGGSTYTVVINNPQIRNREDVSYFRQQIEEALRDVSRGHKLQTI